MSEADRHQGGFGRTTGNQPPRDSTDQKGCCCATGRKGAMKPSARHSPQRELSPRAHAALSPPTTEACARTKRTPPCQPQRPAPPQAMSELNTGFRARLTTRATASASQPPALKATSMEVVAASPMIDTRVSVQRQASGYGEKRVD